MKTEHNSIRMARLADEIGVIKQLFLEYADSLNFDLDFQDFREELETLPGKYGAPEGSILVAKENGAIVGCVAVRPLGSEICEMKRLYVKPAHRGKKVGRELAVAIIEEAKRLGYKAMRLDTVETMQEATALYRALGFQQIDAYCHNPLPGAMYFELKLTGSNEQRAGSEEHIAESKEHGATGIRFLFCTFLATCVQVLSGALVSFLE